MIYRNWGWQYEILSCTETHYTEIIMKKAKHANRHNFYAHLSRNITWGIGLVLCALFIGMLGYHFLEKMSWIDSFLNAAMILSGMGPVTILNTTAGKLFAGSYALFSGLTFIVLIGVLLSPSIHLIIRKIHLESSAD
jgi:peptidoglycan/LPS O-acetylase OafA/YrhL